MAKRFSIILLSTGLLLAQESATERAWKLAGSGHRQEAIQLLRQSVQAKPNDADAHLLLGSLLGEQGQKDEAIAELSEAVHLQPNSAEALNALGEAYIGIGDFEAARSPLENAVAINGKLGVAHSNLGRVLLESKEFDAAASHLDKAIEILPAGPDSAIAHYLRAKVYAAKSDPLQAEKQLDRALAQNSTFPEAWSDLGEARKDLSDHVGAIAAFNKAVRLAPNDSVAQYRLGEEYLTQHQPHRAVEPLEQAVRLSPHDHSILNALQKALRQDGQIQEADKVKQQLSSLLAQDEIESQNEMKAIKLNNEGARLQHSGDLKGALEKYSAAARLSPGNVPIRVNYAVAMLRLGDWTHGLNELHESLSMDPNNLKIKAALRDALAQAPPNLIPQWKDESK